MPALKEDLADEIIDIFRARKTGTRDCLESLVLALCATVAAAGGIPDTAEAGGRLGRDILGLIELHIEAWEAVKCRP